MKNYYIDAMTIVSDESTDWKKLVIEIAKRNPKKVVDAFESINPDNVWKRESRILIESNNFIEAIKHCRRETGLGLKEAKMECDALKDTIYY